MNQWEHFRRSQEAALRQSLTKEIHECECGSTWFVVMEANQYITDPVVPGQAPASLNPVSYPILRCARCFKFKEYDVNVTNLTDKIAQGFYSVTEEIARKNPEPTYELEPTEESDEDQNSG